MNKRFFFWDFYKAYSLSLAIMEKEHNYQFNPIKKEYMQKLMVKHYYLYLKKVKTRLKPYDKDSVEKCKQNLQKLKEPLIQEFNRLIISDTKLINQFFDKYKDITFELEEPKNFDGKGVIAVLSNYYSYEN